MLGICIAFLFFGYLKLYTATTFIVVLALLLYIEYKNKLRFMYRFYRTYLVLLIPFYLGCMVIKKQSLLIFNENASLKLHLAYLPIEAYFYFLGMLLMAVYLFELFKSKMVKVDG
ncbi:lycopene cyclase domain-containing protein [Pedobacter hiemivivus]|uniref:lycopene cyclase domain-containing protein n=1 Tax=Pedobacter hiemivivus TaxID=2530454 RepID=UPI001CEDC84B